MFVVCLSRVSKGFYGSLLHFGLQISTSLEKYFGYANGASHNNRNLSSIMWDFFSPNGKVVSLQGICIVISTNNIVEYRVMVELLSYAILHGIHCLVIRLDSQLMVLQLYNFYLVRSPTILCMFLRVHLLEIHFDFIQHEQISRNLNTLTNELANHVLDRHLQ